MFNQHQKKAIRNCYKRGDSAIDRLAKRQALKEYISQHSADGLVVAISSGRDCDGTYGQTVRTLPAQVVQVERFGAQQLNEAEGQTSLCLETPNQEKLAG